MNVLVKWAVGSRTLPLQVHHKLTIADVKDMVRDQLALPMSTKLQLYTDENLVLECQDDASLGGYRALQDGSSLYLAPYGLDFVKLEVQHKTHTSYVTPVDAMGYRTADGNCIVGYDLDNAEFHVNKTGVISLPTVQFQGPLRPPDTLIFHGPLGRYGQCAAGEVKIISVSRSHVIVHNADGKRLAMLPKTVQPLTERLTLRDVRVVVNRDDGMIFKEMTVTGGVMQVADQVLDYLHKMHDVKSKDIVRVRRIGGLSLLEPMLTLRRVHGLVLHIDTTFTRVNPPAKRARSKLSPLLTTAASLIAHSYMCDMLDQSPWLLPRNGDVLLQYLFPHFPKMQEVKFDHKQLRAPYTADEEGMIRITTEMPTVSRTAEEYGPDDFVHLVRQGYIRACSNHKFVLRRDAGWAEALCTVDLSRKHVELEDLYSDNGRDPLLPLGQYNMKALIQDCPTQFIMEMLGSAYDPDTGIVTF